MKFQTVSFDITQNDWMDILEQFKDKDGDKSKNNKLMSLHIDDDKLLEKYKTVQTNIQNFKNIEVIVLPVYDDRCIKTKIKTCDVKVYTNFRGLNVPEDGV